MAKTASKPPKGGRKGGSVFPRVALKEAVGFAKKLVSKTQVSPLPAETIYPAVFGVSSKPIGEVRTSALKQFGLLEGDKKAFKASELARQIAMAPPEEQVPLYQKACLRPRIFKGLYEVFQGDTTTLAKIRQQCGQLGVHVDSAETCARNFIESLVFAGLGTESNDTVVIAGIHPSSTSPAPDVSPEEGDGDEPKNAELEVPTSGSSSDHQEQPAAAQGQSRAQDGAVGQSSGRSIIHVNLTLDSSLDTEKLEKQLLLLRRFGAI
jgi:hypothetical protein